jgi:ribosome maturation factor RimP
MARAIGKQDLIAMLEPTLQGMGFDLVDIDANFGRNGLLRVFIDKEPQVTLADCEFVSEQLSAWLDVEDPLPANYTLEVSSPGVDRRLRTSAHFQRFLGAEVKLELSSQHQGRQRFRGQLTAVDTDRSTIGIEVDAVSYELKLNEIAVARLVPKD